MSNEAELKIRITDRKQQSPSDAFWFGFAEWAGKVTGGALTIAIVIAVLRALDILPVDPT